ncbi:MAG: rhodanese-like domain-containing protein [Flavobacteriaceae bacterium]|nr:rhodanese-like domain-containing protein [Flavobacteriaceae bacterium]
MENYILIAIILVIISFFGYKTWKLYQPKKTLTCIDVADFKNELGSHQKIQLIDVRSEGEFDEIHIPNALNIPLEDLKKGLKKISKDTKIVVVCLKGAERSQEGAIIAAKMGFNATWLCGGTHEFLRKQ